MSAKNVTTAKAYYNALNNKNIDDVGHCLHPEIHLISPLTDITGKESVLKAISGYMTILNNLTVRTACGTDDQVILVYDYMVNIPNAQQSTLHAAVLMHFKDDLIDCIELFFDARPFAQ